MYADENVIKIKHAVLLEVAKAAFAGNLDEIRDDIPFTLIPDRHLSSVAVSTRREIIRQRVRLAEGKAPSANDDGNIIQVINSACEDCPISSYTVTENCQNCLGKACINACKFEQSRQDVSAHISTHRSVRSVDAVHRHVLTTLSLI